MKQEWTEWQETQPALDVNKLMFIDETGTHTSMTRACERSSQGERCHAAVPNGHWKPTT